MKIESINFKDKSINFNVGEGAFLSLSLRGHSDDVISSVFPISWFEEIEIGDTIFDCPESWIHQAADLIGLKLGEPENGVYPIIECRDGWSFLGVDLEYYA